jgi:hypothetical protein
MRRLTRQLTLLVLFAWLAAGCERTPQLGERPLAAEASYRLLFNEEVVGEALFSLAVEADGGYRLQVLTVPAGRMARPQAHEILETSTGVLSEGSARPTSFEYSALDGDRAERIVLRFDWEARRLELSADSGERRLALGPGVQDRLSYLLEARRLAFIGQGQRALQIAGPDGAVTVRLEPLGRQLLETPAGPVAAVGVSRTPVGDSQDPVREIWFDAAEGILPLRVAHGAEGGRVTMERLLFTRLPRDPR